MKKITVKSDTRTEEYIVFDNLEIHNDALFYHCTDGMSGAISLRTDRQVIIEDYKENRDWVLVAGMASQAIYSVNESHFSSSRHVKLQDRLTEEEANELVTSINQKMNSYKIKGE